MGNGVNLGNAAGTPQDFASIVSGLTGQTTVIGNGLNLGSLNAPKKTDVKK